MTSLGCGAGHSALNDLLAVPAYSGLLPFPTILPAACSTGGGLAVYSLFCRMAGVLIEPPALFCFLVCH